MGTTFTYSIPVQNLRVPFLRGRKKAEVPKKVDKMPFNEFPKRALKTIFGYLSQPERQKQRLVCRQWNTVIQEEFPVELVITQLNHERLFRCSNAVSAEIQSLAVEYKGDVNFGATVRTILFSGKVLSSNLFSILQYCPDLETLRFSSLKQVMGIEGTDSVKLPKLTTVEIKVRPDQETFTADEIIIISVLRQMVFGSLKTILISTKNAYEDDWNYDEEEEDEASSSRIYDEETRAFSVSSVSPMSSGSFSSGVQKGILLPTPEVEEIGEPGPATQLMATNPEENSAGLGMTPVVGTADAGTTSLPSSSVPQAAGTQTTNTNLVHVIINRAANFANGPAAGSDAATASTSRASTASSTRRVRHNISEFEARLFYANLEILMENEAEINVLNVLNDSRSRTRIDSTLLLDTPGMTAPALKHTVFFELLRNNYATIKKLIVRARSDFTCFGNLSSFMRDVSKVQFEEMEYSFGRMQMCQEHYLLRAQTKLESIKVQILDDMWRHLMFAIEHCQNTLQDIDIKVLSVGDDNFEIGAINRCSNLKSLKLLHFYEKDSLANLPRSLNKLVLNGPVKYNDMLSWTNNLQELADLTLLLNIRGDRIDLKLYKRFVAMPKISRLTFIQCPMDLEEIQRYYETTLKPLKGVKFWYSGPKEIKDIPTIQYVYTLINPDEFDRTQIRVE